MNAEAKKIDDDFEFEIEGEEQEVEGKAAPEEDVDIEIEDDTPEEDRGRSPLPKEIVEELEADELEDYSEKVKQRLKQMKKVWHDERREKERAMREQQEAIRMAQKALEENKRLKSTLTQGEQTLMSTYKQAAELEMEMAKRAYKEAYESGDSDALLEAQNKLNTASYKMQYVQNYQPGYQPSLQNQEVSVNTEQNVEVPRPDAKTLAWQERNPWWGTDQEMTALALGVHQKLAQQKGAGYIGSDDYWQTIDTTMRRRFPDYFGDDTTDGGGKPVSRTGQKPATVVAPASRSRSPKKIVLNRSQLAIAKKLGLTPEQYAREMKKLEG